MPDYGVSIKMERMQRLAAFVRGMEQQDYAEAIGEAGVMALNRHLSDKEQDPASHATAQRLGAQPQGIYADMARSLSHERTTTGVTLTIHHRAAAQRYFGGTIEPGPGKSYLTIPAIAEAYGVRAGDAPTALDVMLRYDSNLGRVRPVALVDRPRTDVRMGRRRRDGSRGVRRGRQHEGGRVWYWLVESVTQDPDPTVLPSMHELAGVVTDAITGWMESL